MRPLGAAATLLFSSLLLSGCGEQLVKPAAAALVRDAERAAIRSQGSVALRPLATRALTNGPASTRLVRIPPAAAFASVRASASAEAAARTVTENVDAVGYRFAATPTAHATIRACTRAGLEAAAQQYVDNQLQGNPTASLDTTLHTAVSGCLATAYPQDLAVVEQLATILYNQVAAGSFEEIQTRPTPQQYLDWLTYVAYATYPSSP
jgi:hypothetical protein